ncbi:MAG: hypothetical protein JO080_08095 [Mucilaginibacter sp.]|nr:hypothetical protein [Mucilaginibacter sp.]
MRYFRICTLFLVLLNGLIVSGSPIKKDSVKHQPEKNDSVSISWLPQTKTPANGNSTSKTLLESFLAPLNGAFRPLVCKYNEARLVSLLTFKGDKIKTEHNDWSASIKTNKVAGEPDAIDVSISVKLRKGGATSTGIAIAFDIANWSTGNYVLIPASVYNGNRNRVVNREYATGLDRADLYKKDLQLTTVNLPQLSPEPGKPSKLEVSACNATTPAICFYNKKNGCAFITLAGQGTHVRDTVLDNGFTVEESPDRSQATLVISAPGVRERKPEFIGFSKSQDRGMEWKAGDEVTLRLRLYSFKTNGIPGLLDKFMSVRKEVTGPNHPRNLIPFSEITHIMTNNIDKRFYNGNHSKFYCPENAQWISFGWIGGLMDTFPMLALGDQTHLDRVTNTFDFAIPRAQGASGYFYGALNYDGKCFGREGYDEYPEICLTRKNGDVLFWMIKQFNLLKAQGRASAIKPEWESNIKRLAQAFVYTWKKDGQWGNFVNNQTGDVAVYNTSSGVTAIGGLALAAKYYNNPEFLKIAEEAADFYYNRDFVKLGMTTGACADILQNADSETAAGFMTSLMTLYEVAGDLKWLEKSRNLANLFSTWAVSYDYELPANTELAQLGAKLTGAVWASTQNKHGAPGICTSSGDPLFKIYRATGDRRYADLMHDIVHAYAEGIQPTGNISERLTYCDADSRGTRGGYTGWNELNGILMAMELPGIYLQTDRNKIYVLDHVEAKIVKHTKDGIVLSIANPTRYGASVSILAETMAQSEKPLGNTAFLKWPKVDVKAGETVLFHVNNSGNTILPVLNK